jgi:hypothetical protein
MSLVFARLFGSGFATAITVVDPVHERREFLTPAIVSRE